MAAARPKPFEAKGEVGEARMLAEWWKTLPAGSQITRAGCSSTLGRDIMTDNMSAFLAAVKILEKESNRTVFHVQKGVWQIAYAWQHASVVVPLREKKAESQLKKALRATKHCRTEELNSDQLQTHRETELSLRMRKLALDNKKMKRAKEQRWMELVIAGSADRP